MISNSIKFSDVIKKLAVKDYLSDMSCREVGRKYKAHHRTIGRWVLKAGYKLRTRKETEILSGRKMKGIRRSPGSEFKKGDPPWNKDTKGIMKPNKTSFKKGVHYSITTEFKKGMPTWNKNIPCSEDTKKKISEALKGKLLGSKNPNWLGGPKDYGKEFNFVLKEIIRSRDNYKCRVCEKTQKENKRRLSCHHIDYNKKNCKENNLISLCDSCHMTTNFNREYWEKYLKEILC